ncbi:unnamed protein product [Cyprideis torosa]|uniref:Uncharacterized protein n=2 Tax=Cyprideis torosa TaxID=163714 RepID=A0A7R8WBW0_9CRUS|nr:unnamed protein product [Cyprideis torosa]CAG0892731.1 unnamed protein product [Cyprideis torosa]
MGPPQQQMGPPQQQMGPLQQHMGPPQQQMGPPQQQTGPPQQQMGPPQQQMGHPQQQMGPHQQQAAYNQGPYPPPPMGGIVGPPQHAGGMGPPPAMGAAPSQPSPYMQQPPAGSRYPAPPRGTPGYPPTPMYAGGMMPPGAPLGPQQAAGGGYLNGPPGMAPQGPPGLQQQAPRKLDPDQMPSPIQVMEDDQKARSGPFKTAVKGQTPPMVLTDYLVEDTGYASPRLLRASTYHVPSTSDMSKQTGIPFAVAITPFAEIPEGELAPPISPPMAADQQGTSVLGPVRCNSLTFHFHQMQGLHVSLHAVLGWRETVHVPILQRPNGSALGILCSSRPHRPTNDTFPKPPGFVFCIDVSYNNIRSGLLPLICANLQSMLSVLPKEHGAEKSVMRVGFITYGKQLHFYNCSPSLAAPQMLVVPDVEDVFMPLLDGFLVDPEESASQIKMLLEMLPGLFAATRETETILGPAIQAGMEALKASERAGKVLVFHSSLPTAEAPGKLKNRDDRKLLGTEKEKAILTPQNTWYNTLAQECVSAGVSVDLFLTNNSYIDVATIGQVARLTGGQVNKYTYFQADVDGERLLYDLRRALSRAIVFDAVMRVRTSTGIRPVDFYGHLYMANTTDIELAAMDSDKSICVEMKHDDKLTEEEAVFIQVAILFTSVGGQRRLRILNLACGVALQMADSYRCAELDTMVNCFAKATIKEALINKCAQILACYRKHCASPSSPGQLILPEGMKLLPLYINCLLKSDALRLRILNLACGVALQMADSYRCAELDTMVNCFAKATISHLCDNNPKAIKEALINKCAQILACYRKHCASPSSPGQLILPEGMKLLPLYINCLLKSDALSGGQELTTDDRAFQMMAVMAMDVVSTVAYFYPRLIPLHEVDPGGDRQALIPAPIRCLSEKLKDYGIYLLENGIYMFLWVGLSAPPDLVRDVFGVDNTALIDETKPCLPPLDNERNRRVREIVEAVQTQRSRRMRLTLVKQRDKMELVFRKFLVEDRSPNNDGSASYVDFLCHIHKEVRQMIA